MDLYRQTISELTDAEKDRILYDLFLCIHQGRILDACNGWDVAGTLADGTSIYRPRQMGFFGTLHQYVSDGAPPTWNSLPERFRGTNA